MKKEDIEDLFEKLQKIEQSSNDDFSIVWDLVNEREKLIEALKIIVEGFEEHTPECSQCGSTLISMDFVTMLKIIEAKQLLKQCEE